MADENKVVVVQPPVPVPEPVPEPVKKNKKQKDNKPYDVTIAGGQYIVGDTIVDANGNSLED